MACSLGELIGGAGFRAQSGAGPFPGSPKWWEFRLQSPKNRGLSPYQDLLDQVTND
jgi:hypothetical protein